MRKRHYETEAQRLGSAIVYALEAFSKYPPTNWSLEQLTRIITAYQGFQHEVIHPHTYFKNLKYIDQLCSDAFTYFQEGSGPTIDYFWERIQLAELGYKRADPLQKVLRQRKLRSWFEYDFAVDILVVAQQEGRITEQEAYHLSSLIEKFESK